MTSHRDQLRTALVEAAGRQITAHERRRRLARTGAAVVAFLAVTAGAFIGLNTIESEPASATTFEIQRTGDEIFIEIIGRVDDPEVARAELAAAGIDATLEPQAAAPSLEGVIVAAEANALDTLIADGTRVEQIQLGAADVQLTIFYGRLAEPGEAYIATESTPNCATDYARRPVTALVAVIEADHGPVVRFQRIIATGAEELSADDLTEQDIVVDVLPLTDGEAIVLVTQEDPVDESLLCR